MMSYQTGFRKLFYILPVITVGLGLYVAKNIWVAMLSYHFCAILILLVNQQGFHFKQLLYGGSKWQTAAWMLFSAFSGVALFGLGYLLDLSGTLQDSLSQMGLSGLSWPIFIVYYSLVNPVIEEVYWRGFLGSHSKRITWSDVGYGGYHPLVFLMFLAIPWAILEFIALAAMGWMCRRMVREQGGLLIPFAMHLSADLSIAIAIYLLVRGR